MVEISYQNYRSNEAKDPRFIRISFFVSTHFY